MIRPLGGDLRHLLFCWFINESSIVSVASEQMRSAADGNSVIQMLTDPHGAASETGAAAVRWDLEPDMLKHNRVVLLDNAFILNAEDLVEINI